MPANDPDLTSPYAPIRYRDTFWWPYAKRLADAGFVLPDGRMDSRVRDRIMEELILPVIRVYSQQMPPGSPHHDALGLAMAQAFSFQHWVPLAAQYEGSGREIFDFSEGLVQTLNHTDIKDATLEDLNLPYPAFYIRFGAQEHIRLEYPEGDNKFEFFDGVFVTTSLWDGPESGAKRLLFGMTTVLENGQGMASPGYFLDVTPDMQKLPCLDAIEAALARRRQLIEESEVAAGLQQAQMQRYEESAELLRAAMPLVLNALFYLDSLGSDQPPHEPGRGTSKELAAKWAAAEGGRKRKVASTMTSYGYALVHVVGKEFETHDESGAGRGAAAPGWRRGHWRWQAHGPRHSLRKRIRIPAVFVNPQGRSTESGHGHIYQVDEQSR
jgi:hypothetical protein